MAVIGAIELPYAFTMLFGRNPYGNPVSKGERRRDFGNPVCVFEMDLTELRLIVTGLLPQPYRGGARARGGGIDIYFFHRQPQRRALRAIINNCSRIHPPLPAPLRPVPNPIPSIREGGVDIVLAGGITRIIVSSESELQSRDVPPVDIIVDIIAEARQLPLFLELEAPNAGDRIHLGGRFWTPYYRATYLTNTGPAIPIISYGITIHIPFEDEYSQFIHGMIRATV